MHLARAFGGVVGEAPEHLQRLRKVRLEPWMFVQNYVRAVSQLLHKSGKPLRCTLRGVCENLLLRGLTQWRKWAEPCCRQLKRKKAPMRRLQLSQRLHMPESDLW